MLDISPDIPLEFPITHFNIIIPFCTLNSPSSLLVGVLIASAFCKAEQDIILKINSVVILEILEP